MSFGLCLFTTIKYLNFGCFPSVPPVRYGHPDTEQVSLHSKSLCKNMARASGVQIISNH